MLFAVFEISWFPWQPIMPTVKNGDIRTKSTHILITSHPRLLNMVQNLIPRHSSLIW